VSACRPEDFVVRWPEPKEAQGLCLPFERGKHYCTCCGTSTTKPLVSVSYKAKRSASIKEVCEGCLSAALEALRRKP
jgi:hypothetical protein